MDIKKWSPWNWFHKEENEQSASSSAAPPAFPSLFGMTPFGAAWQQEVDRMFNDAFRRMGTPPGSRAELSQWLRPSLDIVEDKDAYSVSIEVPGVEEKDIQIDVQGDTLSVRGEKKQSQETSDKNIHRVERSYGMFQRTLSLPMDANAEAIQASFKDGVLNIRIGKQAQPVGTTARRIEIGKGA